MEDKSESHYKSNEEQTKWQSFKKLVWNSETKEFFGRTGLSWFKITLFYIIFYACLAAFWTCMLVVFYQTLESDQPKWKLDSSRIGGSPGLGFRPAPPQDNVDSTLIWFNATRNETVDYWVGNLNTFLKPYNENTGRHVQTCTSEQSATKDRVCYFPTIKGIEQSCSSERQFGFPEGKPCVLIKLNRIYDWKPENFDTAAPEDLTKQLKAPFERELVYITCVGENSADKDNIGEVMYFPSQGIQYKYFPFLNQDGYLSPYVFAQFSNINRGVLVNVECRAWAKNINYNRGDRLGSVHFELLVD